MPRDIEPMLATLVNEIPGDEQNWIYEIKWDGYRALAYLNKGAVEMRSRNNKSFNEKFYPVYDALEKWRINAVVDGEIVVINDQGMPDFGDLQLWRSEADGQLVFYLFDVLWLEGSNVMNLPLEERHQLLSMLHGRRYGEAAGRLWKSTARTQSTRPRRSPFVNARRYWRHGEDRHN